MGFIFRTPNLKKSFAARTTAKWKRAAKRKFIPGYGKKNMGFYKNPRKALYNYGYSRTTIGFSPNAVNTPIFQRKEKQKPIDNKSSNIVAWLVLILLFVLVEIGDYYSEDNKEKMKSDSIKKSVHIENQDTIQPQNANGGNNSQITQIIFPSVENSETLTKIELFLIENSITYDYLYYSATGCYIAILSGYNPTSEERCNEQVESIQTLFQNWCEAEELSYGIEGMNVITSCPQNR